MRIIHTNLTAVEHSYNLTAVEKSILQLMINNYYKRFAFIDFYAMKT